MVKYEIWLLSLIQAGLFIMVITPIADDNGRKFKTLQETYKMNTFLFTIGLMYPNPRTDAKRKLLIGVVIISLLPAITTISEDMRRRILRNDLANFGRQLIIMASLLFAVIKLIMTIFKRKELRAIFDGIDEDYEKYNSLPEELHPIIMDIINKTKTLEKMWISVLFATVASYPVLAGACTIYSQLFSENPRKFMIHETAVIFLTEEQKYESPYFELFSVYTMYIISILFVGFTGYDGMFFVCILHVSLKIKIFNYKLKHIMDDVTDTQMIKRKIENFVTDHCEAIRLIGEIQKCFEIWLVGIFINAVVQIGMSLCQITSNAESDINGMYYFFISAIVLHIFLPCYILSDVTHNAAEVANVAYSCSWESIQDVGTRKSIMMIINKAQIPIHLRAFDMLTFNMELFVSILQTAYSMYTLLRT